MRDLGHFLWKFIENNIICDNVDYSNFYNNTRYSLGYYIYILRKTYNADDIYNIYKNNIVSSHEFGSDYNIIKNFKKMNDNRKYFKKVSYGCNYKIVVNLDFSENDESEDDVSEDENQKLKHVNKNRNEIKDFEDFIEDENVNKDENRNENVNEDNDFIKTKIDEDEIEDEIDEIKNY